jgi:tight adherence protein B
MHRSAQRLQSPLYSSVMTTLLVARKSGGNLPKILDESSGTLREMERLAGVVRTKTAEGRSQTFVLALLPFVMIMALQKVDPEMIPGLAETGTGRIIIGVSVGLWVASIALARRIVQVDI